MHFQDDLAIRRRIDRQLSQARRLLVGPSPAGRPELTIQQIRMLIPVHPSAGGAATRMA